MPFQPRLQSEIVNDALAYIAAQTDMTTEVGSFVRSLVEAYALEMDEANYQMVQAIDGYAISTATGTALERRAADYDITRLQPAGSTVYVVFRDGNLVRSTLLMDEAAGATTIELRDSSKFPTGGYPYNIRIGEGTLGVEEVQVSNNNVATNTLTLTVGCVNTHAAGESVCRVTGAANILVNAGQSIQVPPTGTTPAIVFVTQEPATIVNGYYQSGAVLARSQLPGSASNIGGAQITQFATSAPFNGAEVTNISPASGGRDLETDQQLRDRILNHLRSLSTGNIYALRQAALGVSDDTTGQRCVSVNVIEDFITDEVRVLVDDGTGFSPTRVFLPTSEVQVAVGIAAGSVRVSDASQFPREGYVILSPEDPLQIELIKFTSVNYATNSLSFATNTTKAHNIGDEVVFVEVLDLNAEPGRNFWNLANFAIVRNSARVWLNQGAGFALLNEGTDYYLNKASGQIEIAGGGVAAGSKLVVSYSYYTGLIQLVQLVLNGSLTNPVAYPGVRAAGVEAVVEPPSAIRRVRVRMSISALPTYSEALLRPLVQEAVELYVNSLGIGNDVIRAELITAAMNVPGVYNAILQTPTEDIPIGEDELALAVGPDGASLVVVA